MFFGAILAPPTAGSSGKATAGITSSVHMTRTAGDGLENALCCAVLTRNASCFCGAARGFLRMCVRVLVDVSIRAHVSRRKIFGGDGPTGRAPLVANEVCSRNVTW